MEQTSNQLYEQAVTRLTERINPLYQLICIMMIASIVAVVFMIICIIIQWNKVSPIVNVICIIGFVVVILLDAIFFPWIGGNVRADKILVDKSEFIVLEGKLVGFAHEVSSGRSWYKTGPILKPSDSEDTIVLNISDAEKLMEIGSTYKVVYLPNTRYAEIIECK